MERRTLWCNMHKAVIEMCWRFIVLGLNILLIWHDGRYSWAFYGNGYMGYLECGFIYWHEYSAGLHILFFSAYTKHSIN